jgi:uncharacterized membrane protein
MTALIVSKQPATTRKRLLSAGLAGGVAGLLCIYLGAATFAALAAWDTTVIVYGVWVWCSVRPMTSTEVKAHALGENPGRAPADILLLFASVASIAGVAILLINANKDSGGTKAADIIVGLLSIVLSWAIVHLTYMLRYARLYYGKPEGGVEFNESDAPRYADFAYLAFTLGMTFQVSDTNLKTKEMRSTALKHALLAYLFGTVIIATTINTLASLSQ